MKQFVRVGRDLDKFDKAIIWFLVNGCSYYDEYIRQHLETDNAVDYVIWSSDEIGRIIRIWPYRKLATCEDLDEFMEITV